MTSIIDNLHASLRSAYQGLTYANQKIRQLNERAKAMGFARILHVGVWSTCALRKISASGIKKPEV